jgi:small subunit ribosomal protein S1
VVTAEAVAEAPAAGKVDLSAFSSMLKTKWKTGAPAPSAKTAGPEEVKAGQVRNFRIAALDVAAKRVDLEMRV